MAKTMIKAWSGHHTPIMKTKIIIYSLLIGLMIGIGGLIFSPPASLTRLTEKRGYIFLRPVGLSPTDTLLSLEDAFEQVAETLKPAVVNISFGKQEDISENSLTPLDDFFEHHFPGQIPEELTALGSGFIIDPEGYIITNHHLVKGATEAAVTFFNGRRLMARVVGTDPKTDLAVLKVEGKGDFPTVKIGDSNKVKVGSWAIAVGNPFGLDHTVTVGVISGKGRSIGIAPLADFIQTDASINPGNSGGPLVNINGEVIGVNTAIDVQAEGIGFAIPINIATKVISDLKKYGKVVWAWMTGLYLQDITPSLAKYLHISSREKGVLVADLTQGSEAEKAGIRRGDVILSVDGNSISSVRELQRKVLQGRVGQRVVLSIFRKGQKLVIPLTLSEMPSESKRDRAGIWLGLTLRILTPALAKQFNLPPAERGLLVSEVDPESPAYTFGLKQGDIIKEINNIPIDSLAQFQKIVKDMGPGGAILLLKREGHTMFLAVGP
ncbi:MAG: Do family serine endopeptidase [bacterium]